MRCKPGLLRGSTSCTTASATEPGAHIHQLVFTVPCTMLINAKVKAYCIIVAFGAVSEFCLSLDINSGYIPKTRYPLNAKTVYI